MTSIGETTFVPQGVYRELPTRLRGGYPYHFTVKTYKSVKSCKGLNFEELYARANEIAQVRVKTFECSTECSPLDAVEVARAWNCEGNVAWASVKYLVICPAKQDTYSHLGPATGFDQPAWEPPKASFDNVNEVFLTTLAAPVRMIYSVGAAKRSRLFDYTEYDRDCAEYQRDPAPFEARAKAAAELASRLELFDCNLPGHLHVRTKIRGRQCKDDLARLRVKIEVDCS